MSRKTRTNNASGLKQLIAGFKHLKLDYVPSGGNFILVKVGDGHKIFVEMQKLGVIARPVVVYQLPEWLRITVGTPEENSRCLLALEKALSGLSVAKPKAKLSPKTKKVR